MLRHLFVSNYALIDEVSIYFKDGFTTITGETGSGKSILLGALSLVLGDRAESRSIKDPSKKCIVEATFDLRKFDLQPFFKAIDIDYDDDSTLRREIGANGKSRSFINDTPASLSLLKELGIKLIDIHSQHHNSLLHKKEFRFAVMDAFAQNETLRKAYFSQFENWKNLKQQLEEILEKENKLKQEIDYLRFQFSELENIQLEKINKTELEQELETLTHAELIVNNLNLVVELFDNTESGALAQLNSVKNQLSKISQYSSSILELHNRLDASLIELKDIAAEANSLGQHITYDEAKIAELNSLLAVLSNLLKKHNKTEVRELLDLKREIELKIIAADNFGSIVSGLKKEIELTQKALADMAIQLTTTRTKASKLLEKNVHGFFSDLSLENAELRIDLSESAEFNSYGKDQLQFLFKANKGGSLLPINDVASGGEISRVMLALKASVSKFNNLPSIIFDEIDQGIGGEVARKTGLILKEMSKSLQVIVISHLPQISGKADHHFKVVKFTKGNTTRTDIIELNDEERVNELAEMLSGKKITEASLENARQLMSLKN